MSEDIILYDLASRGRCASWSFNVWKTRLVLNYKGISYRTEWVDHVNIAEILVKTGVSPNTSGQGSAYTVPTIRLPNGTCIRDSAVIAQKLEELYPSPSLYHDANLQAKTEQAIGAIAGPLLPIYMSLIHRRVIVESSIPYFLETREKRFGMSLEKFEQSKGGEQAWKAAEPGFKLVSALLTEHKRDNGPFILGTQLCYADFIIAAMAESIRRIDMAMYERCLTYANKFGELHEACKQWTEKDT